jgi:hypothetical protein
VTAGDTNTAPPECAPLCGASKAYGRFDQPWKHEPECPVRLAWEAEKVLQKKTPDSREGGNG